METGRIAIIKLTKIFIIFMHKYNMIRRRQCVKLKAQTHLNMPIVYAQSYWGMDITTKILSVISY